MRYLLALLLLVSHRAGRRWCRIGTRGRAKATRAVDKGNPRYTPPKRPGRWAWGVALCLLLTSPALASPISLGTYTAISHVAGFGTVIQRDCVLEFYDKDMRLVAVLPRWGAAKGQATCA